MSEKLPTQHGDSLSRLDENCEALHGIFSARILPFHFKFVFLPFSFSFLVSLLLSIELAFRTKSKIKLRALAYGI
jgi:hypothetical protein